LLSPAIIHPIGAWSPRHLYALFYSFLPKFVVVILLFISSNSSLLFSIGSSFRVFSTWLSSRDNGGSFREGGGHAEGYRGGEANRGHGGENVYHNGSYSHTTNVNRNVNLGNTKSLGNPGSTKNLNAVNPNLNKNVTIYRNVGGNVNVNRNVTLPKGNVGVQGAAKGAAKETKQKGQQ
jgi:hypothetical protein